MVVGEGEGGQDNTARVDHRLSSRRQTEGDQTFDELEVRIVPAHATHFSQLHMWTTSTQTKSTRFGHEHFQAINLSLDVPALSLCLMLDIQYSMSTPQAGVWLVRPHSVGPHPSWRAARLTGHDLAWQNKSPAPPARPCAGRYRAPRRCCGRSTFNDGSPALKF